MLGAILSLPDGGYSPSLGGPDSLDRFKGVCDEDKRTVCSSITLKKLRMPAFAKPRTVPEAFTICPFRFTIHK